MCEFGLKQIKTKQKAKLSRATAFPTKEHVRQVKSQIRLRIRAVWSESLHGAAWIAKGTKRPTADSEDSDQPVRMRMLICFRWADMQFCRTFWAPTY